MKTTILLVEAADLKQRIKLRSRESVQVFLGRTQLVIKGRQRQQEQMAQRKINSGLRLKGIIKIAF